MRSRRNRNKCSGPLPFAAGLFLFGFSLFLSEASAQKQLPLERIILGEDSIIMDVPEGILPAKSFVSSPIVLPHKLNTIRFELSQDCDTLEYSYYLKGLDYKWSPWSKYPYREYAYMPDGDYEFHVRAKDPAGKVREYILAGIRVLPSFYHTIPARIIYLLLFLLASWAFIRLMILNFANIRYRLEQIINERTEQLISEKDKSEKLLANVLPKGTADELKDKGKVSKKKYNLATVLFSDIQGFTRIAEEMNPETLIDELDKFFFHFDSVVEKFNIEKIKTIGDAYMCAGGIPVKNRTNPVEVVLAALEMKEFMKKMEAESKAKQKQFWDIRIGIHTGTVIAGVVGSKKLSYDIWGDTVNTASRMESSGEAGKINISGMTYELVRDFFICEYRGKMPVKYKGEIDMYFVNGIRPELSGGKGVVPGRRFILKMQLLRLLDLEEEIFSQLEENPSPDLVFHDLRFIKNVCTQTELLCRAEGLDDEETLLVRTAAVFINLGYSVKYNHPVEASLQMTDEELARYKYSESQIKIVKELVKTRSATPESNKKAIILYDARMDYLGRVDYIQRATDLMEEVNRHKQEVSAEEWFRRQIELLRTHEFITPTAQMLRSVSAEDQILRIKKLYPALE